MKVANDLREHLTQYDAPNGVVKARFKSGGTASVVYRTRFGETRILLHMTYIGACIECNKLRSRGYNAKVKRG